MRFLYIAPRYHTNQIPIMRGLVSRGDEVMFLAHYKALIEEYDVVEPVVLGYSPLYRLIDFLYVRVIHRRDPEAIVYKIAHGFPPVTRLKKMIREYKPDVAILREKSVYSMVSYMICKGRGIPCILYNQSPAFEPADKSEHRDLAHRIVDSFLPVKRMTPVLGDDSLTQTGEYIPFVATPQTAPQEREYFADGCINILCIGKYELRKHHLELLEVLEKLGFEGTENPSMKVRLPIHLTLVGEATNDFQKGYYARVLDYVKEHHLEGYVTVLANIPHPQMDALFRKADIYVLPSTGESASVSQLEAMSYSLPVICSDTNGTACYVEPGVTGYRFRNKDMGDLQEKLSTLVSDRNLIRSMGAAGYQAVLEKYNFQNYYGAVMELVREEKEHD